MKTKMITLKKAKALLILFLIGLGGFTASAQNWFQINSGTQKKINTICFTSSTNGYLGGNDSLLMKTNDGGATWTNVNYTGVTFYPNGAHILNLQFLNDNVGFMTVGPYSGSYGTTNGGVTWSLIPLPGNQCYNKGLFFFDENNGFIGGSGCFQGELISAVTSANWLTGTWNLNTLNAPTSFPDNYITDIHFHNPQYGLAASRSGYIYRTGNGGLSWDSVATTLPLNEITSVLIINDTLAYAGYQTTASGFGLYISTDAGLSWSFDGNSATFYYPDFFTLHQSNDGTIYTGGISAQAQGLIFSYQDNFGMWNFDPVDQAIYDIASYNDSIVFAVGDSGYIVVNHPQGITGNVTVNTSTTTCSIFPNPASTIINIAGITGKQDNTGRLTFYNAMGQMVKSTAQISTSYDVTDLSPGIYFVELIFNGQQIQKKLIIE